MVKRDRCWAHAHALGLELAPLPAAQTGWWGGERRRRRIVVSKQCMQLCAQTELVAQADACAVLRTWFSRRGRPRGETSREHSRQGPQGVPRDHTAFFCRRDSGRAGADAQKRLMSVHVSP